MKIILRTMCGCERVMEIGKLVNVLEVPCVSKDVFYATCNGPRVTSRPFKYSGEEYCTPVFVEEKRAETFSGLLRAARSAERWLHAYSYNALSLEHGCSLDVAHNLRQEIERVSPDQSDLRLRQAAERAMRWFADYNEQKSVPFGEAEKIEGELRHQLEPPDPIDRGKIQTETARILALSQTPHFDVRCYGNTFGYEVKIDLLGGKVLIVQFHEKEIDAAPSWRAFVHQRIRQAVRDHRG